MSVQPASTTEAVALPAETPARLVLGIDTCGPTGSVALGLWTDRQIKILEQIELEGRTYSATLVAAVATLLAHAQTPLSQVAALVAVKGPGSFTGVRIGLSAVKGLAEPAQIPVLALSRLEVLAAKASVDSAALDAHRHELFLRLGTLGSVQECLAGASNLISIADPPAKIAICDEAAAALLISTWPRAELVRVSAPTAADALAISQSGLAAAEFADLLLLDGHYLRRSDAEIFGDLTPVPAA